MKLETNLAKRSILNQNEGKTASIYFRFEVKRSIWKQIEAKRKYRSETK
jgi:hypothetical protein